MEIYGTNLANVISQTWASADFKGNAAPTALGATTVTIGGQSAFIDFVSPGQVNAQVPSNIANGPQPVVVNTPGGASAASTITVKTSRAGPAGAGRVQASRGTVRRGAFSGRSYLCAPSGPGCANGACQAW